MKILLISNMYPSKESPFFGIFVRNFKKQLEKKKLLLLLL
jgi:L-malate glycosyltransferase